MIPLWKGKNPIYFGVITIIPFDNLYRRAYFVMHTFLVRHVSGHVRCSHFHINILVFFVGLSLIVLCYLCDFFFLTLSRSFTCFHNHDNIVQTSSIHLLKGIVSLHPQRNRFQNKCYIRLIGNRRFFDFCKSPIFRIFTKKMNRQNTNV
jgi:hypothetical protein